MPKTFAGSNSGQVRPLEHLNSGLVPVGHPALTKSARGGGVWILSDARYDLWMPTCSVPAAGGL